MVACVLLAAAAEVAGLLTCSFSSAAQAKADPEFRDVRLNEEAAQQIAKATGGAYYTIKEVKRLPDDV